MSAPKSLPAAERVRLYLTLVPYLLERGQVSLSEAAADFGVAPDEMRAMVEKLTVIGLPGENGYWQQPHELFDINWDLLDEHDIIEITQDVALRRVPRFSAREASALIAGLRLVAAVPEVEDSGLVAGLLAKLSRGAATAPPEVVVAPSEIDETRRLLSRALREQKAVGFTYQAPDAGTTERLVEPVQILITNGQWYLEGWCHLREAMRTFHLDRMTNPHLTDVPITHGPGERLQELDGSATGEAVTVQVADSLVPMLAGYRPEILSHAGETTTLRLRLPDPRVVKRLAARFGGQVVVVGPDLAHSATREWAQAGLDLYHQPDGDDIG